MWQYGMQLPPQCGLAELSNGTDAWLTYSKSLEDAPPGGALAAFQTGDCDLEGHGARAFHVDGAVDSATPEGAAILYVLEHYCPTTPLTIATDSAFIMSSIEATTSTTLWRDYSGHKHEDLFRCLVHALRNRRERTTFVKVHAHRGQRLNTGADTMAEKGRTADPIYTPFSCQKDTWASLQSWDTSRSSDDPSDREQDMNDFRTRDNMADLKLHAEEARATRLLAPHITHPPTGCAG